MNLVVWWDIPCKAIFGVFKELSSIETVNLVLITGRLSKSRLEMGWDENTRVNSFHIVLNDEEWGDKSKRLLEKYSGYIHIFGGFYSPKRIKKLITFAIQKKVKFGIFSEAPSNPYSGLKRIAVFIYHNYFLPFYTKKIAATAIFVFCLSGSDKNELRKFLRLGWSKNKIVPFGYFSEDNFKQTIHNTNKIPILLCSGNLVPHKGVEILLKALRILSFQGYEFHCHITGKGSQKDYLLNLTSHYELNSKVTFHGVLNQSDYDQLQQEIDILIAPGIKEAWGIRINEAIQHGQAVLVSDHIGAKELIISSKGGMIFKSEDYLDLANKLSFYLRDNNLLNQAQLKNLKYKDKISPAFISLFVFKTIESFIDQKPKPQASWITLL